MSWLSRRTCTWLSLLLGTAACACYGGDDVSGPYDGGELDCCFEPDPSGELVCVDDQCVPSCDPDGGVRGGCAEGRACVEHDAGVSSCSEECESEACGDARRECNAEGRCERRDHCGFHVPCLTEGTICDPFADACFPRNGDCGKCPQFSEALQRTSQIDCRDNTCRLSVRTEPLEWLSEGTQGAIEIRSPAADADAAAFAADDDIVFSWDELRTPVLIRVLDRVPKGTSDYEAAVVWGASIAGGQDRIAWSEGAARSGREWIEGTPALPAKGVYYLSIIAVMSGRTERVSSFRPFVVGDYAIPRKGSECNSTCENPWLPLTCHGGRCERLCASHLDCGTARCGDTLNGRRMCGINVP